MLFLKFYKWPLYVDKGLRGKLHVAQQSLKFFGPHCLSGCKSTINYHNWTCECSNFSVAPLDLKWCKVLFLGNFTWKETIALPSVVVKKRAFHHFRLNDCDVAIVAFHHFRLNGCDVAIVVYTVLCIHCQCTIRNTLFTYRSEERLHLEKLLVNKLRDIMLQMDLEEVTSKQLRMQLEQEVKMELSEYKGFLDQEMLRILGQMERPSEIFDYLYLVSLLLIDW